MQLRHRLSIEGYEEEILVAAERPPSLDEFAQRVGELHVLQPRKIENAQSTPATPTKRAS